MPNFILIVILVIVLAIIIVLAINYKKSGGNNDRFYNASYMPLQYDITPHDGSEEYTIGVVFTNQVFLATHSRDIYILSDPANITAGDKFKITYGRAYEFNTIKTQHEEVRNFVLLKRDLIPLIDRKINSNIYTIDQYSLGAVLYAEDCTQVGNLALFEDDNNYYYYCQIINSFITINKKTLVSNYYNSYKLQLFTNCTNIQGLRIFDECIDNDGNLFYAAAEIANSQFKRFIFINYKDGINVGSLKFGTKNRSCGILFNSEVAVKVIVLDDTKYLVSFENINGSRYASNESNESNNRILVDIATGYTFYNIMDDVTQTATIYSYEKDKNAVVVLRCLPGTQDCDEYDYSPGWIDPALAPIQFVDTELESV